MTLTTPRRYLTLLIHVLVWGLFGLTFLLFQPLTGRLTMPPQFWLKQGLMFIVWVSVFYLTAKVSVPRLLFQGRNEWFVLALFGTTVAVLLFSKFLEVTLDLPALIDKAFMEAAGRPRLPRTGFRIDTMGLLTTMFVLGISTSITVVQKWQNDAQIRQTWSSSAFRPSCRCSRPRLTRTSSSIPSTTSTPSRCSTASRPVRPFTAFRA